MSNWYITPSDSDLMHFGILGMKWGVRRYQNEDGTLTEAGKKRYRKEIESIYSSKPGKYKERRYNGGKMSSTKRDLKLRNFTRKEKEQYENKLLKKEYNEYIQKVKDINKNGEQIQKEMRIEGQDIFMSPSVAIKDTKNAMNLYKAELKYAKSMKKMINKVLGDMGNTSITASSNWRGKKDEENKYITTIKEDTLKRLNVNSSIKELENLISICEKEIKAYEKMPETEEIRIHI